MISHEGSKKTILQKDREVRKIGYSETKLKPGHREHVFHHQ